MSSLVVRNLDESIINALKARAVAHHRSTEAEHRAILAEVLMEPQRKTFAEALSNIPAVGADADFMRLNFLIRKILQLLSEIVMSAGRAKRGLAAI